MTLLLKASWLLDGRGGMPLANPAVLVDGDRIVAVHHQNEPLAVTGPVMEFPGGTLLPGLIDAHAHFTMDRIVRPMQEKSQQSREAMLEAARKNAWTALQGGITTARDCGAKDDVALCFKRELASGATFGPHLLVSGCALTTPGGHAWAWGGVVSSVREAITLLEEQIDAGIDFVKVMASGGGMTPGSDLLRPQFPREQLQAIVDLSHRRGLKVAAHVRGTTAVIECVATGVDTIEHCSFMALPDGEFIAEPAIVADVRRSGAMVVPTVVAYSAAMLEGKRRTVAALHEAGVPLATGTDAGIPRAGFDDVWREVRALVACGLSPAQAVSSATFVAARALGIEAETGSVEPGKRADLIVVQGNPLEDVTCLARPLMVMKAGQIVVGVCPSN